MSKKQLRRLRFASRCAERRRRRRGRIVSIALALLLLGAATTLVAAPADVFESPGAIAEGKAPDALEIGAGDGNVSGQTGAYQHSISIAVPPGRGVEPSLTLSYSSQQPLYGGIAAGWDLGLPTISRDYSEGYRAPTVPRYQWPWTSSMAGRELVVTSSYEPEPTGWISYRAQSDTSFARYQFDETNNIWRVLQTDGSVMYFGEPFYMDGWAFLDWMPLTRQVDRFGNEVRYHYEKIFDGGQIVGFRPSEIEYTINDNASLDAHAKVVFTWAAPDRCSSTDLPIGARSDYHSGERRVEGFSRLTAITTQVADGSGGFRDVRRYDLAYDPTGLSCAAADRANDSPIRLLSSVTESARSPGGVWTAMPPVTFSYGQLSPGLVKYIAGPGGLSLLPQGEGGTSPITDPLGDTPETMLLDMDGDALADLVYSTPSPDPDIPQCHIGWYKNLGLGASGNVTFATSPVIVAMPTLPWKNQGSVSGSLHIDVVGTMGPGESCSLVGQHTLEGDPWVDNSGSQPVGTEPPPEYLGAILIYRYQDIDGDGLIDLVTALERDPNYYAVPDGWFLDHTGLCTTAAPLSGPVNQNTPLGPEIEPPPPEITPLAVSTLLPYETLCGDPERRYPWNVHLGTVGGGFGSAWTMPAVGGQPEIQVRPPIPLSKQVGERYPVLTGTNHSAQPNGFQDMDGDGTPDFAKLDDPASGTWELRVSLWNGTDIDVWPTNEPWATEGQFRALPLYIGRFEQTGSSSLETNTEYASVLDTNGDGLADIVDRHPSESAVTIFRNVGGPTFVAAFVAQPNQPYAITSLAQIDKSVTPAVRSQAEGFRDIDSDGRPDRFANGTVAFSLGEGIVASSSTTDYGQTAAIDVDEWRITRDWVDLTGDGLPDKLELEPDGVTFELTIANAAGERRGVLKGIDNGRGLTVDIAYAPHTDANVVDMAGATLANPTWVVKSVTATHAHGPVGHSPPPPATTSYAYTEPVMNQDPDGRWGFRGFKTVETTGPSGARTEERFDYELDWSGRQVASLVYPAGSSNPLTIDDTEWTPLTLLDNSITIYVASERHHRTCEHLASGVTAYIDEPTCRAQVPSRMRFEQHKLMAGGGISILYALAHEHEGTKVDDFNHTGVFATETSWSLAYTPDVYRLIKSRSESYFGDASGYFAYPLPGLQWNYLGERTGYTDDDWDPTLRVITKSCTARSEDELSGSSIDEAKAVCAEMTYDMDTGLKLTEQRPEMFRLEHYPEPGETSAHLVTSFDYSGASFPSDGKWPFPEASFKVFPVTVENELGHQVHTHTDLGTGATLATYGPNPNEGSYQIVDGFGRPLETWISTDVAGPGDPYLWLRTAITEYQDLASPQQKIERSSRNPKDEAFYTTSYNDTYWAERRTVYDGAGRVIEMIDWDISASEPDTTRRFVYDAAGNLDVATAPDPSANSDSIRVTYDFSHDSLGRRTCATTPDGTGVATVFGGDTTVVTELVPDGLGGGTCGSPETTSSDPRATRTVTVDLFDRIESVAERTSAGTDAITTYTYDANSNVARIDRQDPEEGDIVTDMTHDWVGNRKSITRDPEGTPRTWLYEYDRDGNLESQTSPAGGTDYTVSYVHDALGRMTSKMPGPGMLTTQQTELAYGATGFTYDEGANGLGRLTTATLPFGSISLVYDAWGNVTDETRSVDLSSALGVTFADTLSVHSEDFTSEGNPMKVVEASGITTIHIPAYFGWRPFQVRAYHDESDFGSSYVTSFTYSYNAAGVPRSIRHFLRDNAPPYPTHFGRIVYYKRDKNGRLTEEYGTLSSSTDDKITQKYTYHGAGEIKTLASRVGGSTDKRTFTFGYDNQHQLTNADDDKGYSGLFTYSPQGRLTSAYIGATPLPGSLVYPRDVVYEYDSTDPEAVGLLKVASTGAEFADFEHDVNGNMTSRVLGSDQWNLVYDGEDRLRIREAPDGGEELYYYHDNARWLAVTKDSVGTVLSARLWFGNAEIRYDCASGTCIREKKRTTLRLGGMAVARFERDVATGVQTERLLQTNLLGHLLGVYSFQDPTGALDYNLEVGYQYGPFGEILEVKEFPGATTSAEDYTERFNGKELDEASGLSYYGYRYYDPLSLTWNRADPKYRFKPDLALIEPRRGALFNFSGNNPIRYVDSDGRDFKVSGKADDIYFHYNFDPSGPGEIETALLNPMDATAIFGAARIAQSRSSTIAGTRNLSHREEDAVRHALWSAISTAEIGSTDAKKFLDAHEKTGLVENQPPAEVIVDLHNNAVGRIVAENNKGAGLDKLTDAVLGALDAGLLITGNPNDNVVITEESKASLNKSSTGTISERYPIQPQTPSGPIDVEFIAPQ